MEDHISSLPPELRDIIYKEVIKLRTGIIPAEEIYWAWVGRQRRKIVLSILYDGITIALQYLDDFCGSVLTRNIPLDWKTQSLNKVASISEFISELECASRDGDIEINFIHILFRRRERRHRE